MIVVAALYKFVSLKDTASLLARLRSLCEHHHLKGTILLATEGINGTVAGSRLGISALHDFLKQDPRFDGMEYKESFAQEIPFHRLKVRLKKEIVTLGCPEVAPTERVGQYVEPEQWNSLLADQDVVVIDTRNVYEVKMGKFQGALDPQTQVFRDFPEFVEQHKELLKNKKVAMYCTGGIRCEKASSYMLSQGFSEVYHLKGGILKYLEKVPPADSLWEGECFVFDERVGIGHQLSLGAYVVCRSCRHPISSTDQKSPHYEEGVCCPYCYQTQSPEQRRRAAARHYQVELARARGQKHIGR